MVSEDLKRNVKSVAERLERMVAYAMGDDEMRTEEDAAFFEEEGLEVRNGEYAEAARDWLFDNLGIKVIGEKWLDDDRYDLKGVEVVFCTGGPHIEFESADNHVIGMWGGESYSVPVDSSVADFYMNLAENYDD